MRRSSSDEPTRRASYSARCSEVPPYAFVSAWDEPTDPEQKTNLETDALKEWYRYIDSLARPPRRLEEGEDAGEEQETIEGREATGRRALTAEGFTPSAPTPVAEACSKARVTRFPPPWGEPWTPPRPAPEELDAAAEAIVEQLAPTPPAPAAPFWSPSVPEIPVPELDAFIPTLEPEQPAPRRAEEVIAALVRPEPPAGGDAHPASESPPPDAACSFSPLGACGGGVLPVSSERPPSSGGGHPPSEGDPSDEGAETLHPHQVDAYPPVTTTALVRVETEEDRTPRRPAPGTRPSRSGAHLSKGGPCGGWRSHAPSHFGGGSVYAAGEGAGRQDASPPLVPGIAQIREQWPRYAERLQCVPTKEVAQNSYKTPFKETREELIARLLDPPLTLEETARLLGVCPTTVRRYTNRGWLKHYRTPGNQRRFRLSAVLAFLEEHGTSSLLDE